MVGKILENIIREVGVCVFEMMMMMMTTTS